MNIAPSHTLAKARFWLARAAPIGGCAWLGWSAPRLVWAQSMNPQEGISPSSLDAVPVTNPGIGGEIFHILPYLVVLTLALVLVLGWFIFRKPTTAKGKAAATKQEIENHESYIA